MKTFRIHSNGKAYIVGVRGRYESNITSERKLREALRNSANSQSNPRLRDELNKKLDAEKIHEVAEYFGILSYSKPVIF